MNVKKKLENLKKFWKELKADPKKMEAFKDKKRKIANNIFATQKTSFWMSKKKKYASYKGSTFKPFSYWAKKRNTSLFNLYRFVNIRKNWSEWKIKEFQLV